MYTVYVGAKCVVFGSTREYSQTSLAYDFQNTLCAKAQQDCIKLFMSISNQSAQTPLSSAVLLLSGLKIHASTAKEKFSSTPKSTFILRASVYLVQLPYCLGTTRLHTYDLKSKFPFTQFKPKCGEERG